MRKSAHPPGKARKSVAMTFRFTPEFRELLVATAAAEHRSQANLIEWLVSEHSVRTRKAKGAPRRAGARVPRKRSGN